MDKQMTIEEAHDIAYEKHKCEERWWSIGIGANKLYIYVNWAVQGVKIPFDWTDGDEVDNIGGFPVIYKRMSITISG